MAKSISHPQDPENQVINRQAESCLRVRSPATWSFKGLDGDADVGLDFNVQVSYKGQVRDVFRIQLKGTTRPSFTKDGKVISFPLKSTTLRLYADVVEPIMLVVVDMSVDSENPANCPAYFTWVNDKDLREAIANIKDDQQTLTIHVPVNNLLTPNTDVSGVLAHVRHTRDAGEVLLGVVGKARPGQDKHTIAVDAVRIGRALSCKSPEIIDALISEEGGAWVAPKSGSLAWHLNHARDEIRRCDLPKARRHLDQAEPFAAEATAAERADFLFLTGRLKSLEGDEAGGIECLRLANEVNPSEKHLSAYVECAVIQRIVTDESAGLGDLLALLAGEGSDIVGVRARILAMSGARELALAEVQKISEPERYVREAHVLAILGDGQAAEALCNKALAFPELTSQMRGLALIINAEVAFRRAFGDVTLNRDGDAQSGIGVEEHWGALVESAYRCVERAIQDMREAGWNGNIEHLARLWAETAHALGRLEDIFPFIQSAAEAMPQKVGIQDIFSELSAATGRFELSTKISERLPWSLEAEIRKVYCFHKLKKNVECVQTAKAIVNLLTWKERGVAHSFLEAGMSAYILAETDLLADIQTKLDEHFPEYAALLKFSIYRLGGMAREKAIDALLEDYQRLGKPRMLAEFLISEMNANDPSQAEQIIQLAGPRVYTTPGEVSLNEQIATAYHTLGRWSDLVALVDRKAVQNTRGHYLKTLQAVALDNLGRSQEALNCLEALLSHATENVAAVRLYAQILARLGRLSQAIDAVQRFLSAATSPGMQREAINSLYALRRRHGGTGRQLLALAQRYGVLADQNDEQQEGVFLLMFLGATTYHGAVVEAWYKNEVKERLERFFERFPQSRLLKRATLKDDASAVEIQAILDELEGVDPTQRQQAENLIDQLTKGQCAIPFSQRPFLLFNGRTDVVALWEQAKRSGASESYLHLEMNVEGRDATSRDQDSKSKIPLLDMTALLVLFDLGILETAIQHFGRIAVPRQTFEHLFELSDPHIGSVQAGKCAELHAMIGRHAQVIRQPISSDEIAHRRKANGLSPYFELQEIKAILQEEQGEQYVLYSDDAASRLYCSSSDAETGFCTFDFLTELCAAGTITKLEKARYVATLSGWRVRTCVTTDDVFALLGACTAGAGDVRAALEAVTADNDLQVVLAAVWQEAPLFGSSLLVYGLVRRMVPAHALVAMMIVFCAKVDRSGSPDKPHTVSNFVVHLLVYAAGKVVLPTVVCMHLIDVFLLLIMHFNGSANVKAVDSALMDLATVSAHGQASAPGFESAFDNLQRGVRPGSTAAFIFDAVRAQLPHLGRS